MRPAVHDALFPWLDDDDLRYLLHTVESDTGLREATDDEITERLGDDAGRYCL